jgi:hypothetical protein
MVEASVVVVGLAVAVSIMARVTFSCIPSAIQLYFCHLKSPLKSRTPRLDWPVDVETERSFLEIAWSDVDTRAALT